jgi:hypothetical protein
LKPAYNAVDMIEVELMDDDHEPREFNPNLVQVKCQVLYFITFFIRNKLPQLREGIINQSTGSRYIYQKYHYDRMVRPYLFTAANNAINFN